MAMNKTATRESARTKEAARVMDEGARKRRDRTALENLEKDNHHDEPHSDLVLSKKIPKFNDNLESRLGRKKKRERGMEYYKLRFRKFFQQLVEEARINSEDKGNYIAAEAPPPSIPVRQFCAVCGFPSNYTCVLCGVRYCCVNCLGLHKDTRCLKNVS